MQPPQKSPAFKIVASLVTAKMSRVICNSRDVADYFKKAHGHVLEKIDALLSEIREQGETASDFLIGTKVTGKTGFGIHHYRAFDMTGKASLSSPVPSPARRLSASNSLISPASTRWG